MIALMVFGFYVIYLLISILVIYSAYRLARKARKNPFLYCFVAGFVMYNLVFWDLIPTYVMFKYYVHTKSGFWVYKTPEQWMAENPGVAETLTWSENSPAYKRSNGSNGLLLNERVAWIHEYNKSLLLPVTIVSEYLVDVEENQKLFERVRIITGYSSSSITAWIKLGVLTYSQPLERKEEFDSLYMAFKELGKNNDG